MKPTLYILGTSNSILQDGYVKYLREHYKVNNLSIGASPFYQYVFNILQIDQDKFHEGNGIVIIDNIVNDDNILERAGLHFAAAKSAQQAILFAASRFPTVVVEFLNKRHYEAPNNSFFSGLYRDVCSAYGIPFFSFADTLRAKYQSMPIDQCFRDEAHLSPKLAYELTPHLIEFIQSIDCGRGASRNDLSAYRCVYSYLPVTGADEVVGTSLRHLPVRSICEDEYFPVKGKYCLEAIVMDISRTNCVLELVADHGTYYQGLRYRNRQKSEFKVVPLKRIDCSNGLKVRILSQRTFHLKSGGAEKTIHESPHEDCISSDVEEAKASLVGFIAKYDM